MSNYHVTQHSKNVKLGGMPTTTSSSDTCPTSCPLKAYVDPNTGKRVAPCYAEHGHLGMHWRAVDAGKRGGSWADLLAKVRKFDQGIWRHNQAGDLPIDDTDGIRALIRANRKKGGFTYTHHNPVEHSDIIKECNDGGFTVNISANNLDQADQYAQLDIAPVVTLLPDDSAKVRYTPAGRKVVRCPAETSKKVTCRSCRLCQKVDRPIIGFVAHGSGKKYVEAVAIKENMFNNLPIYRSN